MFVNKILYFARGGSWLYYPQNARIADRDSFTPDYRRIDLGVRLVEEVN